jgi:DNA phosphorothioation-dependent restriction protein DptG
MSPIAEILKVRNNQLDSYLPIRNKNNDFDWGIIAGLSLSNTLRRQVNDLTFDQFKMDCMHNIVEILDDPEFWQILDRMYFANEAIFRISPLFLLFKARYTGSGKSTLGPGNWRMGTLFSSLMGTFRIETELQDRLNFIEREMLAVLEQRLVPFERSPFGDEQPYLPYLAYIFQEDIAFLAAHPKYLLQELPNTLKLYAFTYCAQLALNLGDWRNGEPLSKPLYFILDTEKASSERAKVQKYGYKLFAKKSENLFPILSALEVLQREDVKRPLWKVYSDVLACQDPGPVLERLNAYLCEFVINRNLPARPRANSIEEAFSHLIAVAIEQFHDEKTERAGVNKKYCKELEFQICSDFIQPRGRAGRVLVLNQDLLLLLTNLSIGNLEKMRFHELMAAFAQRGFYLDNQSRQTLVGFYERMGNVERMSDSGDAVYVRKTI